MFETAWNTITSPFSFVKGVFSGTFGNIGSIFSGAIGSGVMGAVVGAGAGALGHLFLPDILSVLRNSGKAEWAAQLAQYARSTPFLTQMLHAAGIGAATGAAAGGGMELMNGVQSGFAAVPQASADPGRSAARGDAVAQNLGHGLGSAALIGAAVIGGAKVYEAVTGNNAADLIPDALKGKRAAADVPLPEGLPKERLASAEVQAVPTRAPDTVVMTKAQTSMGAVQKS